MHVLVWITAVATVALVCVIVSAVADPAGILTPFQYNSGFGAVPPAPPALRRWYATHNFTIFLPVCAAGVLLVYCLTQVC